MSWASWPRTTDGPQGRATRRVARTTATRTHSTIGLLTLVATVLLVRSEAVLVANSPMDSLVLTLLMPAEVRLGEPVPITLRCAGGRSRSI